LLADLLDAYGADPTGDPGWPVLISVYELRSVAAHIRRAPVSPPHARQAALRITSVICVSHASCARMQLRITCLTERERRHDEHCCAVPRTGLLELISERAMSGRVPALLRQFLRVSDRRSD
jgi:hypothetical protein